jgi:cytochrome c oxidase subunit 2
MRFISLRQLLAATTIAGASFLCAAPAHAANTVSIEASNWKFSQSMIVAHVGQPMTLLLTSKEGVHGIQSTDLGIPRTLLMPGKTQTVTFTPKTAGTYVIHCAVPCGPGHESMALTIKVE